MIWRSHSFLVSWLVFTLRMVGIVLQNYLQPDACVFRDWILVQHSASVDDNGLSFCLSQHSWEFFKLFPSCYQNNCFHIFHCFLSCRDLVWKWIPIYFTAWIEYVFNILAFFILHATVLIIFIAEVCRKICKIDVEQFLQCNNKISHAYTPAMREWRIRH